MIPNKRRNYINADTKEVVFTDHFFDPKLGWYWDPKKGDYILHPGMYGGEILDEWKKSNPKPKRY